MSDLIYLLATVGFFPLAPSPTCIGAGKSDSLLSSNHRALFMGTILIGIIASLLLIYLFATMIYPENF